jgi:hypothetical protein
VSKIEKKHKNFLYTTLFSACLTMLLTLIPVWQLVIIPGIIAGFFNKQLRYAILSGLTGVTFSWLIYILIAFITTFSWLIYILIAFITRNTYSILDQVGALMVGTGFGWLILLIVLFIGILMGALGGGIGYLLSILLKPFLEQKIRSMK